MKNKLLIVAPLLLLGVLTLPRTYINANAALTAPANWDYKYYNLGNTGPGARWSVTDGTNNAFDLAYVRTADGVYYNYSQTIHTGVSGFSFLPSGLTITMTFNRSNSSWNSTGTGLFYPGNYSIGSDNTVGTITGKFDFTFDNQTNKNYFLYFDVSSSSVDINVDNFIDSVGAGYYYETLERMGYLAFAKVFIPAYTNIRFRVSNTSAARYFDAWYLKDLGVSESYTQGYDHGNNDGYAEGYNEGVTQAQDQEYDDGYNIGYDDGYDDGLNATATSAITDYRNIFSMAFSAIAAIFNINIFGGLTLGTIIIAPIAVSLLWFILGIVSGVGGRKQ